MTSSHGIPWRYGGRGVGWAALAGAQLGILECLRLTLRHHPLRWEECLRLIGLLSLFGLLLGTFAGLAGAALAATAGQRLTARTRRRVVGRAGVAALVFASAATLLNVAFLPGFLHPLSLAADALLAAVVLTLVVRLPEAPASVIVPLATLTAVALGATLTLADDRNDLPAVRGASGRPNVAIVLIDTLRADHLGCYGYPVPVSPRIDALAEESRVYERAFSTSNWTRPAIASLFTSTMPSRHGVTSFDRAVPSELPLLSEVMQAGGYEVGFFTTGVNVEPADGYARGVHTFRVAASRPPERRAFLVHHLLELVAPALVDAMVPPIGDGGQIRPEFLTEAALEWLDGARDPWLLYVHYHGPHTPYSPPSPWSERFVGGPADPALAAPPDPWSGPNALEEADRTRMVAQYDAEIAWHDDQVGRLLDRIDRESDRPTIVWLLSDHGEGFGEHGTWGHNAGLFAEITRIPLLLRDGTGRVPPGRDPVPVSLLDVAPTTLALVGLEAPADFHGADLTLSDASPRPVFFENPDHEELGVLTADWAFFEGRTPGGLRTWLYRANDMAQRVDRAGETPDTVRELAALVRERREADELGGPTAESLELDPDRIEKLRALGYLQ